MSQSAQSPLARFIVFMVMLSVAGSILAGFHYYAVDLPQQKDLRPPSNMGLVACHDKCYQEERACQGKCEGPYEEKACSDKSSECFQQCENDYRASCMACHRACGDDRACWDTCPTC
jgi:hypothetical protein